MVIFNPDPRGGVYRVDVPTGPVVNVDSSVFAV